MNIGSTWRRDAALERRFQKVLVEEPRVERHTIAILRGLEGSAMSCTTMALPDHRPRRLWRRPSCPTATSRTASCPTKRHRASSTRRRPAYGFGDRLKAGISWTASERRIIQLKSWSSRR